MPHRPGWTAALVGLSACGDPIEPPWLLGEEPRVLAFGVEVVEPGPWSGDLPPIPADRVRDQGLPGDVVEVSTWIVSAEREYDSAEVDPIWFRCPRVGGCVSALAVDTAFDPCDEESPSDAPCLLARGAVARFSMPPLDRDLPLIDQTVIRIAMVGHTEPELSTQDCVSIVSDPGGASWEGCVVGLETLPMGPIGRLYDRAAVQGLEVPLSGSYDRDDLEVPHFAPVFDSLRLRPIFSDGRPDDTRTVDARPGEVAVVEPGYVYATGDYYDRRDRQALVNIDPNGTAEVDLVAPWLELATATPELFRPGPMGGLRLWAPDHPASFSVYVVVGSFGGGADWARLDFEVGPP